MAKEMATIKYSKKHDHYTAVFPVGYGMPSGMHFQSRADAQAFIESKGFQVEAAA